MKAVRPVYKADCGQAIQSTQVKVSVKPETASAFKAACVVNNVSMASALSDFMCQYARLTADNGGHSVGLSTKRQRRAVIKVIIRQLERVRDNEEIYRDNIPENLKNGSAFDTAEQCVAMLDEAIELLDSAY